MIGRVMALMWKEFLELRQDPRLAGIILVAPILQLTMLGYAATTDVHDVPIVIVDGDRSSQSRALVERFAASPYFKVVDEFLSPNDVDQSLARGRAWLGVIVPIGFGDSLQGQGPASARTVQVLADGTDANSSGVALAYAAGLVSEFNAALVAEQVLLGGGAAPGGITGAVRVWYNPELLSKDFMVPGVLALLLLLITTNMSAMAIVRERELGTLEQLHVTPLGRFELILGKLLPYGVVGFIDVLLVMAVAVFWFEVPMLGSPALLLAASAVYVLCTLALGLFISTISHTQQQAMMTAMFFFLVPMIYLSGFIFPIENMPVVIQWVTTVIPLRYYLVIVRGIFLKGVGFDLLWPHFAALAVWGVVVLALATARSHKTE
ncbi:MAG: ABC transporter permease [Acidobacteria bacterium]|jgi:ABC-2 type transport system permease protein|nr:ABC transporter permease [Acidobacteriota bacterium]